MQYRNFGKTGKKVSTLGFGCMRLPVLAENNNQIDEKATEKLMMAAIEKGVNYFDTAYVYHAGNSETVLGKVLADNNKRNSVFIADKMPVWQINDKNDMESVFKEQCAKLKTDRIDFYLLHSLNKVYWPKVRDAGVLDFVQQLKKDGRIGNIGFSFHDDHSVFAEIADAFDWDFAQIQYNYLDEQFQAGTDGFKQIAQKGMGIVIMEPLRGGNLARKPPEDIQAIWAVSPSPSYSPAEWSLRWLLDKPEVSVILSGLNEMEHLEENCRVASEHLPNTLTPEHYNAISTVRDMYMLRFKTPCTACAYCMPCPSNVNIPAIFRLYNEYALFGDKRWCGGMYNFAMNAAHGCADQCVECGQCESACPQKIEIIECLKLAHADLQACGMPV